MKQYLLACLLVLLLSAPIWSNNGDSASALEVTGIVIDGDLADWPTHIQWHSIGETVLGDKPKSDTDLKAVFATALDPSDTTLVVGIRVEDDSVILDSAGHPTRLMSFTVETTERPKQHRRPNQIAQSLQPHITPRMFLPTSGASPYLL